MKAPDYWPGYDVIVQPPRGAIQRISMKPRTFEKKSPTVDYSVKDAFDWLAVVILHVSEKNRRMFLIPKKVADDRFQQNQATSKVAHMRYKRLRKFEKEFSCYENNFRLDDCPANVS